MAQVQITQSDISSLADKLAGLEPDLTPAERALLLFMLEVAADSLNQTESDAQLVSSVSPTTGQTVPVVISLPEPTPSIHEQFSSAFTPGAKRSAEFRTSVGPAPVD